MTRRALIVLAAVAALLGAGGLAVAASVPGLTAAGPVRLDGTPASAAFVVGDRTVRQFTYVDRGELGYTFRLRNTGAVPVTVTGVGTAGPASTLLRVDRLERAVGGRKRFTVPAGGAVGVRLALEMTRCEQVSSRAGSFLTAVRVRHEVGGLLPRSSTVTLPEELHTGSPREALCPRATADSRSPG